MRGTEPPASRYPTLAAGTLVAAHKAAMGFPTLPGLRPTLPERDFVMPVFDYDWGPDFKAVDGSGIPSLTRPKIKQVLQMMALKVDADGNELGGLPVVLADAPLGTYLGWNVTADGAQPFHKDQICNYVGGMLPFARNAQDRLASGDSRLSLAERYGSHDGYVAAVRQAALRTQQAGFLLAEDAQALIVEAQASAVLR
ncbi:MAG: alpha/beta hydrolase domain-containing protein [Polaromonas sp.]